MKYGLFIFFLVASLSLKAQVSTTNPKTYAITGPIEKWQQVVSSLDSINKIILDSDIPTRKTVYATTTLSFLIQTIQMQVTQQLAAEQKAAADSTQQKKPKK